MNEEELLENEEEKPEGSAQQFDPKVLSEMLNTGENQAGMVTLEKETKEGQKEEPLFTEVKEENKVKPGKIKNKLGKYVEKMLFDMKKNPEKYMIQTSEGLLSIEEAMKRGYDPATKEFTDKGSQEQFEESLMELSESGRETARRITSPQAMQMPASEAEALGIEPENPMVAGSQQLPAQSGGEEIAPELLAALGGGQ
jgi:hypothetical protein